MKTDFISNRFNLVLPMRRIFVFILLILSLAGKPQSEIRHFTLDQTLEIARYQSLDALNAKEQFQSSFWEFKSFRGDYLPQVKLNATIPDLQRVIQSIPVSGVPTYVPQQYTQYSANLGITQRIGLTGGTLSVTSGLQRMDNIINDSTSTSYLSTPINIGYSQPIFQYNPFKWERKIQPLKYSLAKRKYLEDIEQVNINASAYFFGLLQAQIEKKIALTNLSNYDTLYRIAKGRYQLGKIAENDLLLLELNFLKAQAAVENANLGLDNALFRFKSFLRIKDTTSFVLIPPSDIQFVTVNPSAAVDEANKNSSSAEDFQRRLLEAARDVNIAKMEGRFDAKLTAVFGYNQTAPTLQKAYYSALDQEQITLGMDIPILDWGVARGKIKMAESRQEIVKNSVEQDAVDFQRNVYLKVIQFNMQKNQLRIAAKSDTVARKTYEVTKGRYLIGKINSILDLNNAQIETDNAEKSYYEALQTYWRSHFELRKMTLFDFQHKEPLQFNFEDVKP
jgi:outer membrane protein TolC